MYTPQTVEFQLVVLRRSHMLWFPLSFQKSRTQWKTITPRHIMLGVRNDAELNELLKHVHISHGGVLPCIHPALLKRKGVLTNSPGQGGAAISGTSLSSRQASSGITSSAMVTS
ncbi:unnamed protein product [Schistosoma mattheei]|uniref:Histone H2A n=1 Tax=Schistosoma mattheei TaxID=31246 RepID=A0AA85ATL9_9TREM|nr:unnamed protein product [Schistosoma mattheei]